MAADQDFNLLKDDEAWDVYNDEAETPGRAARSSNSQTRNHNPELSTIQPSDESKLIALKPSKKMLREKIRKLRAKNQELQGQITLLAERPREKIFPDYHDTLDESTQTPSSQDFEAVLELQSEALEKLLMQRGHNFVTQW